MLGEVSVVSAHFFLENLSARCEHGHFTVTTVTIFSVCVCLSVWLLFPVLFISVTLKKIS